MAARSTSFHTHLRIAYAMDTNPRPATLEDLLPSSPMRPAVTPSAPTALHVLSPHAVRTQEADHATPLVFGSAVAAAPGVVNASAPAANLLWQGAEVGFHGSLAPSSHLGDIPPRVGHWGCPAPPVSPAQAFMARLRWWASSPPACFLAASTPCSIQASTLRGNAGAGDHVYCARAVSVEDSVKLNALPTTPVYGEAISTIIHQTDRSTPDEEVDFCANFILTKSSSIHDMLFD
ncbi:hypothetical protein FB451DRAFT_1408950 [Mycena latifolia]|nr:hypothetical protein FB451DRAFT_1408950 [Mycena latifolia]